MNFYQNNLLQIPTFMYESLASMSINAEVLKKHVRTEFFSEDDLQCYLEYLLIDTELDLDIFCPAFGALDEGPALSQLRQLAKSIAQQPNAISSALEVFDHVKAQKSTRQSG